jgi:hypothetical protein
MAIFRAEYLYYQPIRHADRRRVSHRSSGSGGGDIAVGRERQASGKKTFDPHN